MNKFYDYVETLSHYDSLSSGERDTSDCSHNGLHVKTQKDNDDHLNIKKRCIRTKTFDTLFLVFQDKNVRKNYFVEDIKQYI